MIQTADGKKLVVATATGPASDTTVAAGAAADLSLSYARTTLARVEEARGVRRIAGLPDGVVLVGFEAKADGVTVRVYNATGADVTVSAGSVTTEVELLGY